MKIMKVIKMLLFAFLGMFITSTTAYAAEEIPPLQSPQRISWALECAGPMPDLLIFSLVVICVLVVISVIVYRKGGNKNER